jgi:hypothetical protein
VGELGEFLPILFGCLVALIAGPRPSPSRLRIAVLACVLLGPTASLVNGEIGARSFLVVFDVIQVMAASVLVGALLARLRGASEREGR